PVDGGGEQSDAGPGWWRSIGPGGTVEADDRMKVDNAAPLVFGDLGEGDPHLGGERLVGEPGLAGEGTAQGDGEPAPQVGGTGVEEYRAGVVVTVRAQWLPKQGVVSRVYVGARQPDAVGTESAPPSRSAAQDPAVLLAAHMDRAERGRGQRCEDARMAG